MSGDLQAGRTTTPEPKMSLGPLDVAGQSLEVLVIAATDPTRPPILLLHEGLGSVSLWRDFPERVAKATGARTIAYSRLGHGRSAPRTGPFRPDFMHDEGERILPALREALGIERPLLAGHSTGASMALIHAGMPGSDVAGVVAMAPLTFVEDSNLTSIRAMGDVYRTTDLRAKLARHHDDVDGVFWGWNDIWLDPAFRDWNIAGDMARIRCPILGLLGEADEYSTRAQIALIPRSAVHAPWAFLPLARCGHAPHRDRP